MRLQLTVMVSIVLTSLALTCPGPTLATQADEKAVEAVESAVPLVPVTLQPDLPNPTEGASRLPASTIRLSGVIAGGGQWKAVLTDMAQGTSVLVTEGEDAFGYRVVQITSRGVLLEDGATTRDFRLGTMLARTESSHGALDVSSTEFPNLVDMTVADRRQWFAEWRQRFVTPDQKADARLQMRMYWATEWRRLWETRFSRLPIGEQQRFREEVSGYWRW
jgi:hypothetical protein